MRHPELPHGISLVIVLVAFFGSLNLLAVALVGEYLIKIFEETKRRPKFIRKSIRRGQALFDAGEEVDAFVRERSQTATARRALKARLRAGGHDG